jgi:hypothetical protein
MRCLASLLLHVVEREKMKLANKVSGLNLLSLLIALALTLSISSFVSGFSDEPSEFRGIKWGTEIGTLKGMEFLAQDGDLKFFERQNDPLTIENVQLDAVVYGFYRDQFFSAMAYYASLANFLNLKDVLSRKHGEPFRPAETPNRYFWSGEKVDLLLIYDENTMSGRISYFYKPLQSQAEGRQQ